MTSLLLLALLSDPKPALVFHETSAERFAVTDLRLVAIVTGDANPVAMLEDPDGVGTVVFLRSRVGNRAGRVTAIYCDCVTVTEQSVKTHICIRAAPRELLAKRVGR